MANSFPQSPFAVKDDPSSSAGRSSPDIAAAKAVVEQMEMVAPLFLLATSASKGSDAAFVHKLRVKLAACASLADEILSACTGDDDAIEESDLRALAMETAAGLLHSAERGGIDGIQERGMVTALYDALSDLEGGYALEASTPRSFSSDFLWKIRITQAFGDVLAKAISYPLDHCRSRVVRDLLVVGQDIAISTGFSLIRTADLRDPAGVGKGATPDEAAAAEEAALSLLPVVGRILSQHYSRASSNFKLLEEAELEGFLTTVLTRTSHDVGSLVSFVRMHG